LTTGPDRMSENNTCDPLHGITLKTILNTLVDEYGWELLGRNINIRCFTHDPSIASSLKFLRKTPWARDKVEALYLRWKMNENVDCNICLDKP
jgi:uncharacterized protein (DUF2132 family)